MNVTRLDTFYACRFSDSHYSELCFQIYGLVKNKGLLGLSSLLTFIMDDIWFIKGVKFVASKDGVWIRDEIWFKSIKIEKKIDCQ